MPKKKYRTEKQRREAILQNAKNYYQVHKDEPEFKEKRRGYYKGYYRGMTEVRKQAYRSYNSEYSFYMRSIVTGRFEKRILKSKKQLQNLQNKILEMENKLQYMKNKFGHLIKKDN